MKLQWFKFYPSEWMMGKIQRMTANHQAAFIRLCCMYWKDEGEMPVEDAKIECNGISEVDIYSDLLRARIISERADMVSIKFLDEQLHEIDATTEKKRRAGRKGGIAKASNSKAGAKHNVAGAKQVLEKDVAETSREEKTREEKNRKEKRKVEKKTVLLPWSEEVFEEHWNLWKEYKKDEHKFTYKSAISEQGALKQLTNVSNGSMDTAIKIIHQSISNGYKGLFTLAKQESNSNSQAGFGTSHLDNFVNQ